MHRIGRTGRAGREGRALTITTSADTKTLAAVEKFIGKKIELLSIEGVEKTDGIIESSQSVRRKKGSTKKTPERKGRATKNNSEKISKETSPLKDSGGPAIEKRPRGNSSSKPSSKPQRKPESTEGDIIGMGSHVPAFMLRSCTDKDE